MIFFIPLSLKTNLPPPYNQKIMKHCAHYLISCLSAIAALTSCSTSVKTEPPVEIYFTDNITIYPADAFTPDSITASVVIDEVIGAMSLTAGNGLIAVSTPQDEPMVKIYTSTGQPLGAFCNKGQGPDDFLNTHILRPHRSDNGDTCIWINDVTGQALKRLNISLSRREGHTKVDSVAPTAFGAINALIAGDMLVFEMMDNDAYKLRYRNLAELTDTLHTEQMYIHPSSDFYAYTGNPDVSPDGKHLAIGMSYFNQINIIDLPGMERRAVSIGNLKKYDHCYNSAERMPKFYAYGSTTCGNNDVYAIYYGMADDDIVPDTGEQKGTTIHVIAFDGTVRRILAAPELLVGISFDEDTATLYGIGADERIYKYDLNGLN